MLDADKKKHGRTPPAVADKRKIPCIIDTSCNGQGTYEEYQDEPGYGECICNPKRGGINCQLRANASVAEGGCTDSDNVVHEFANAAGDCEECVSMKRTNSGSLLALDSTKPWHKCTQWKVDSKTAEGAAYGTFYTAALALVLCVEVVGGMYILSLDRLEWKHIKQVGTAGLRSFDMLSDWAFFAISLKAHENSFQSRYTGDFYQIR